MLISNAYAQAAADAGPLGSLGSLGGMLPIILMFVVLWFLMIRPQMKRAKEAKAMIAALAKGDEVVLAAGVIGRISKVGESYLTVEVAENVNIVVQKSSVGAILPKGTIKTL